MGVGVGQVGACGGGVHGGGGVEVGQGSIGGAGNVQYSPKCQNAS